MKAGNKIPCDGSPHGIACHGVSCESCGGATAFAPSAPLPLCAATAPEPMAGPCKTFCSLLNTDTDRLRAGRQRADTDIDTSGIRAGRLRTEVDCHGTLVSRVLMRVLEHRFAI